LQRRIAFHGFLNSLAQIVLKVCSPGVPDFYQGSELWDFSLVDPDNRRPVDYETRIAMLRDLPPASTLLRQWTDGRIKLFVTAKSLAALAGFGDTPYRAVAASTPNAIAFTRGENVLVVVPRLTTQLAQAPRLPMGEVWQEHALDIGGSWRNVFTDEVVESERLTLKDVFARFPVAILQRA
jgi:(1->4)-alpha-D-glucan 1-alpha-D-glucosylmutase